MSFDQVNILILDLPIYAINGLLWLLYALASILPALVSAAVAGVMMLVVDDAVQKLASARPLRDGRGGLQTSQKTSQIVTGIVLALWIVAQWGMGAPVPWIGATMWIAGLLAILAVPAQRFSLLNGVKVGIVTYALAVIISRIYLVYTSQISPEQWAALLGFDGRRGADHRQHARQHHHGGDLGALAGGAARLLLDAGPASLAQPDFLTNPPSPTHSRPTSRCFCSCAIAAAANPLQKGFHP